MILFKCAGRRSAAKEHLGITAPEGMGDHKFLTTILKDYNAAEEGSNR